VLLAGSGCGGALQHLARDVEQLRRLVRPLDCGDGAPVRVLTDPRCPDGICGLSCAPDRWWPGPAVKGSADAESGSPRDDTTTGQGQAQTRRLDAGTTTRAGL
jgi:hypothetical protein